MSLRASSSSWAGSFLRDLMIGVVVLGIDDFHALEAERQDLADGRLGQRLEGAGHGDFAVANVGDEHLGGDVLVLELLAQGEVLDLVEQD